MKLTDLVIRALLVPAKGQKTYRDGVLPGFGCRVSQGGAKTFVVQYGADRRLITIGRYPIISLADAREEAKRILAEATLGKHRPRSIRWDEARELYLAACNEKNRASTVYAYSRILKRHFAFGRQQLTEITPEDIERKLGNIKARAERNHALVAVKVFLGWCQKPPRRYIPHNPCEGMVPTKRKARKRILTDAELKDGTSATSSRSATSKSSAPISRHGTASPKFRTLSSRRATFPSAPSSPMQCFSNTRGTTTRAFRDSSHCPKTWAPRNAASAPTLRSSKRQSCWRSNSGASARPIFTGSTSRLSRKKFAGPDRQNLPFKSGNPRRSRAANSAALSI